MLAKKPVSGPPVAHRVAAVASLVACAVGGAASASEGGSSIYLQGTYGDFGAGINPPGFQLRNDLIYWEAEIGPRPLGGGVSSGIDQQLWLDYLKVGYFSHDEFLGGRIGLSLTLPGLIGGDVERHAGFATTVFDTTPRAGIGDPYLLPQINWASGVHHFTAGLGISIPVGRYHADREVTAGRGYWGLDPQVTYTFLNEAGWEISGTTGMLINDENSDTNYRTGEEFHIDALLGKRWGKFGLGAVGYWYEQQSDDNRDMGPIEDGYEGRSGGYGLAAMAGFDLGNYEGALVGKWIHDFTAENHLEGDLYMLSFVLKPLDRPPPPPMPIAAAPPPPPAAPPPPPPPPADSDGDGVIDANDLCPNTARGDRVDAVGCSCDVTVQLHFATNSADLTPEDKQELDNVLRTLSRLPAIYGEVAGYTDSRGSDAYNLDLSSRRAKSVVDYMVSRGIPSDRLSGRGYGEADPVGDNTTKEGQALNRRVVLRRADCGPAR